MSNLSRKISILLTVSAMVISLALAGCGGGSGSSIGGGGAVGKSPISGASVFARLADGSWTSTAIGTTGTNGAISFTGLGLLSAADYPAVLKATGGTLNSGNGIAFAGELRGVLTSATSNVYLTPASTVVASLYDQGKTLEEAQNQVRAIVQNTLGYTGVDPLGDFTANTAATEQNEVAQQALLFTLGVTDAETNASSMGTLLNTLESVGTQIAAGTEFTTIATNNSGYTGVGSLASYVDDNAATINQIAANALGTTTAALSTPAVDTSEKPDKFVVNAVTTDPTTTRSAATIAADTTSNFSADGNGGSTVFIKVGLTSSTGTWTTASDSQFKLTAAPSLGTLTLQDDSAVAVNDTWNAANAGGDTGIANAMVFKYVIPSSTSAQTVTFSFQATGVTTGATVTRTVTVQIVNAATTVTSSGLSWNTASSSKIEELAGGGGSGTTLAAGANDTTGGSEFQATVGILGGSTKDADAVNAEYKVSFLAPDGFAFRIGGTNWSNYDQASVTGPTGDNYAVTVPAGIEFRTTAEKAFGSYPITVRLIKKSTGAIERSASGSVYFVRSGDSGWAAKIDTVRYTNTDGTTASTQLSVNGSSEVAFATPTTFTGRVLTWADLANGTTAGPAAISGTWYLIAGPTPTSGTYGLGNGTGGTFVANYDATTNGVVGYSQPTVTVTMSGKYLKPNYGTGKSNQDTITIKLTDTNGFDVESNGGVTISSTP